MADELEHKDIEAGLETRRELGSAFDAELVAGFADRIEKTVQERVGAVASQQHQSGRADSRAATNQMVLGIVSAGAAIPISVVLGVTDHLPALLVSWAGIVGVNLTHAWSRQPRRR